MRKAADSRALFSALPSKCDDLATLDDAALCTFDVIWFMEALHCKLFTGAIDQLARRRPRRVFVSEQAPTSRTSDRLLEIDRNLERALVNQTTIAKQSAQCIRVLDSVIYKYASSYKHFSFMRRLRQSASTFNRLLKNEFSKYASTIQKVCQFTASFFIRTCLQHLRDSEHQNALTREATQHLMALLLQRLIYAQKLRLLCAQTVEPALQLIEQKHHASLLNDNCCFPIAKACRSTSACS